MSMMDHMPVRPITAVAWTSNSSTCPRDFTMINITEDGSAASFTRSFVKSGYYLCYSKDLSAGMVVSEIQLLSDKDSIPHGFCFIAEHLEPKVTVSKKKRVCVRVVPVGSVDSAVLDIKLTAKSKMMLQHYTYVGDINGYVVWCRKGRFSGPTPQAKPRSVSLDIRRLSLDQTGPTPQPLRPSNNPPQPAGAPSFKLSHRRHTLNAKENQEKESSIFITALDGVPFSLHPRFEADGLTKLNSNINNIRIKSLQDINSEYNYTFSVEERCRSSLTTGGAAAAAAAAAQ